jgi:hypothetical protein
VKYLLTYSGARGVPARYQHAYVTGPASPHSEILFSGRQAGIELNFLES